MKKKVIQHDDLKEVVERRKGNFSRLNPGQPGTTEPWRTLSLIGLSKLGENCGSFSGPIELVVGQAGLRNREISRYYKERFKTEILPAIRNFDPVCGDAFHLHLHYREGLLLSADLEYISSHN